MSYHDLLGATWDEESFDDEDDFEEVPAVDPAFRFDEYDDGTQTPYYDNSDETPHDDNKDGRYDDYTGKSRW